MEHFSNCFFYFLIEKKNYCMFFLCNLADCCSSCQQSKRKCHNTPWEGKKQAWEGSRQLNWYYNEWGHGELGGGGGGGDSVFPIFHRISSAENIDLTMPSRDYLGILNQPRIVWKTEQEWVLSWEKSSAPCWDQWDDAVMGPSAHTSGGSLAWFVSLHLLLSSPVAEIDVYEFLCLMQNFFILF